MAAAIIPAVISAIGGYLASRKANKKSSTEKSLEKSQLDALQYLMPLGKSLAGQGQELFGLPISYFKNLAGGNRNALSEAISPQLSALHQQDEGSLASIASQSPRGGGVGDALSRLPFRSNMARTNLLMGARSNAMGSLMNAGQNLLSTGVGAIGGGSGIGSNLLNYGLNKSNQAFDQGSATGESLYQIAKAIGDAWAKRGSNGSNGTSNPWGTYGSGSGYGSGDTMNGSGFWS